MYRNRMTLSDAAVGANLRVVGVDLAGAQRLRAAEMGVRAGATSRVVLRAAFQGVVLALDGSRIALDGATARAIRVEPVTA